MSAFSEINSGLLEVLAKTKVLLEFEEANLVGPSCENPDQHEELSRELIKIVDETLAKLAE